MINIRPQYPSEFIVGVVSLCAKGLFILGELPPLGFTGIICEWAPKTSVRNEPQAF